MKLLKPDATTDGKIIFNFEHKGEIITIIKEVANYTKTTLQTAKKEAIAEVKTKAKDKEEKKNKRETALAALTAAGIGEEIIELVELKK
jgi:hypothetical protein